MAKRVRRLCYLHTADGAVEELCVTHVFISSFSYIKPPCLSFCLLPPVAFLTCVGKIYRKAKIKAHDIFLLPTRMLVL